MWLLGTYAAALMIAPDITLALTRLGGKAMWKTVVFGAELGWAAMSHMTN